MPQYAKFLLLSAWLCSFCTLFPANSGARSDTDDASRAVQAFYDAYYTQRWEDAAAAFHPETLKMLRGLFMQIAETPSSKADHKQFLDIFGVRSLAEFKKLDGQTMIARVFRAMWRMFSDEAKHWWKTSKFSLIGTVKEGELYHVVFRTSGAIDDKPISVVSVATAKQDRGTWKLLSSAELQSLAQKLGR